MSNESQHTNLINIIRMPKQTFIIDILIMKVIDSFISLKSPTDE